MVQELFLVYPGPVLLMLVVVEVVVVLVNCIVPHNLLMGGTEQPVVAEEVAETLQ